MTDMLALGTLWRDKGTGIALRPVAFTDGSPVGSFDV